MIYHLFEGKYLSPFKTDNPKIIGQLRSLKREFDACDGKDPQKAKSLLRLAAVLHGELMDCEFCGQNNTWEHSKGCPLNQESNDRFSISKLLSRIYEWETGFGMGLNNQPFPGNLLQAPTFMLGFGRGQSERIKRCAGETDCLYDCGYGKEEYRRIAI